jgi:hypothetical protein
VRQVNSVEQHGKLCPVHLNRAPVVRHAGHPKLSLLQSLKIDHKTATLPKQDLAAIQAFSEEDVKISRENIQTPLTPYDSA